MKVLILSPLFYPQGSGAEISTMLECKELLENGVDVVVVTNNKVRLDSRSSWLSKAKTYQIPMFFNSFIYPTGKPFGEYLYWFMQNSSWKYVRQIARNEKVDLIHIEHSFIGFSNEVLKPIIVTIRDYWPLCPYRILLYDSQRCCGSNRFPHAFSCRNDTYLGSGIAKIPHLTYVKFCMPILYAMNNIYQSIMAERLSQIDLLITVSGFMKEVIGKNLNIDRNKIEVLHTPIVPRPYVPHKSSGPTTLSYFGALEFHKGVMNLLYAFALAVKENSNLRLFICGDGSLKKRIKEMISRHHLSNYVTITGKIDHTSLDTIYKQTDIVVLPSLWPEPFARAAIESLTAGRIVLANPAGGTVEQIEEGKNGFYANCFDIHELARKIIDLGSLPREVISDMGVRAREYTLKKFDPSARIRELLRIYEKVLNARA